MAKQYKRSDIAENDIFGGIAESAENALDKIKALDAQIAKFLAHYKELLGTSNTETLTGIKQVLAVSKDLDKQTVVTIQLEKEKVKLQQLQVKLASDEAKAMQQTIKAQQQKIKSTKTLTVEQALLNEKQRQANEQSRAIAKFRGAEAGSLQQLEAKMKLIELAYTRLTPAQMENEKIGIRYLKSLQATRSELQAHQSLYGKHTLNVGNYKSAYDGLGMSVSQLAREMPAFANSMQTGFMAISNNLPIFFDEIQKIKRANAELVAQGEPVKSVFKQIGSAVFSWSSLLSVGVTLLTVFGTKIVDYVSTLFTAEKKTSDYAKQQKILNEQHKQAADFIGKESKEMVMHLMKLSATNKGSKERSKLLKEINEKYGTHLKNLQDETLFQAQVNKEVQRYIEYQKQRFRLKQFEDAAERNVAKQQKLRFELAEQEQKLRELRLKLPQDNPLEFAMPNSPVNSGLKELNKNISETAGNIERLNMELRFADDRLHYYGYASSEVEDKIKSLNFKIEEVTKKQKELNTEFDLNNQYTDKQLELLSQYGQILAEGRISDYSNQIKELSERMGELALQTGEVNIGGIQSMIEERTTLETAALNDRLETQIQMIKASYQKQTEDELVEIDKKNTELLSQEGLTAEARAKIEENYQIEVENFRRNEEKRQKDMQQEIANAQLEATNQKTEIAKKGADDLISIREDLNAKQEQFNEKELEAEKKKEDALTKKKEDELKKRKEFQDSMVEETLQEMKRISEEQEKMIDKQIEASQKLVDALQAQANAGNIQASQSIAQQQKVINEQIALKKKEQKEQQFLEELKLLYTATENYVEKGDTIPVAGGKAFLQVKGVQAFVQALKGFYTGTKRTVGEELGNPLLSGKDGYVVRVDGQEKILNPELSRATGSATTDEIVNGFLLSKSILSPMAINQSVVSDERLINEIQDLKHVIANKKELSIEADKLSDTLFQLAYKSKQGNTTTIDKYRYRS